jgi:hypothetical protein
MQHHRTVRGSELASMNTGHSHSSSHSQGVRENNGYPHPSGVPLPHAHHTDRHPASHENRALRPLSGERVMPPLSHGSHEERPRSHNSSYRQNVSPQPTQQQVCGALSDLPIRLHPAVFSALRGQLFSGLKGDVKGQRALMSSDSEVSDFSHFWSCMVPDSSSQRPDEFARSVVSRLGMTCMPAMKVHVTTINVPSALTLVLECNYFTHDLAPHSTVCF